jgi:hypothetical protein
LRNAFKARHSAFLKERHSVCSCSPRPVQIGHAGLRSADVRRDDIGEGYGSAHIARLPTVGKDED